MNEWYWSVFKTLINICNEAFIQELAKDINYIRKKAPS